MTEIPISIRVGYRDYAVEVWPTQRANAAGRYGECDKSNAIIRVDTSYGPTQAAETLLHEVLHACYHIGGIDDADPEERTVTHLSSQLAGVIRDNPQLVAYLADALATPV